LNDNLSNRETLRRFRWSLLVFIAGLVLSGVTAFPLQRELELAAALRGLETIDQAQTGFDHWIVVVRDGLRETYSKHPWIGYGTDWLAFAHIAIAVFFIGPYRDPVRNIWVLRAGLTLCAMIIPFALVFGELRGIPFGWRLIDCSFGVFGALPLLYCLRIARELEGLDKSVN
jgi:hypothetical protein